MKLETNSNDQNLNDQNKNDNSKQFGAFILNFEHLNFDIVSDFDIRISDLLVLCWWYSGQLNCWNCLLKYKGVRLRW
jgi:hypothetical protein